ncbi:HNH endonuclease [Paraburkholderia sp. 2C]
MDEVATSTPRTRSCLYCGTDKPISEFSLEHIFPDSLGGSLCSDIFKTRQVCQRCNNLSGLFIDGPFIRSWFRNNQDAMAAREYLTLDGSDSTLPLIYIGELRAISTTDEVCESWLGPCGEHIYHFHKRDDERFATYLGGDPIARQKDTGRAYLALTASHPWWISLALRSFKGHFRRAQRYALNFSIADDTEISPLIHVPDAQAQADIAKIQSLGNGPRRGNMSIAINAEARFMAKIARAVGYNLFGDSFLATPYAAHLKEAMWEQDIERANAIPIYGAGFWGTPADSAKNLLSWRGAYTVILMPSGDKLGLHLVTPAGRNAHIAVSNDPTLWQSMNTLHRGQVYVIAPQAKEVRRPNPPVRVCRAPNLIMEAIRSS